MADTDAASVAALKALETGVKARLKTSSVDAANGVAGLDANGKLATSKLGASADVLSMLGAADNAAIRSRIGATNLTIGTTAGTAKAGDWQPGTNNVIGLDAALNGKADAAAMTTALAGKLTEPTTNAVDGKVLGRVAGAPAWVDPPDAGTASGTITDTTYTPDPAAPEATDLASIAWAAGKAPTFTNPATLPIGDWATNIFDQTSADNIKTTTNISVAASNHDLTRQYGLPGAFWIDPDGNGTAGPYEGTVGSETELWGIGDEWDMKDASGAITGVWVTGDGALARAQAEAAMIPADMLRFGNFGKGVLYGPAAKATPFLSLVDVASADAYPYTDHEFSTGGYTQCQYLGLSASGGEAVRRAASYCLIQRRMRERLDRPKPTGQVIELTATSGKATVSPVQAVGAAWAALIGGASFIIWFYQQPWIAPADGVYAAGTTYSWPASVTYGGKTYGTRPQVTTTTGVTPGTNEDVWGEINQQWLGSYNQGAAYQSALAEFKSQTGGIARALRSDSIAHTATAGVNTRVVSDGTYLYLLAQPSHSWVSGTSYTLNLPAGVTATSADVMWSGGTTAPVSGGAIAGVTFAKEYTVRVYRVEI